MESDRVVVSETASSCARTAATWSEKVTDSMERGARRPQAALEVAPGCPLVGVGAGGPREGRSPCCTAPPCT